VVTDIARTFARYAASYKQPLLSDTVCLRLSEYQHLRVCCPSVRRTDIATATFATTATFSDCYKLCLIVKNKSVFKDNKSIRG